MLCWLDTGLPIFTVVPPSLATPKERSTFQQACQAEGFPSPTISWRRSGLSLPTGKTVISNGSLVINNICPVDSGLYECEATNSLGSKKTSMNVVVQQQPPKGLGGFCLYAYFKHYSRCLSFL